MANSRLLANKRGTNYFVVALIVVVVLYAISTQKVSVNDRQYTAASPSNCALIHKAYDAVNHVCVPSNNYQQVTTNATDVQEQEGSV